MRFGLNQNCTCTTRPWGQQYETINGSLGYLVTEDIPEQSIVHGRPDDRRKGIHKLDWSLTSRAINGKTALCKDIFGILEYSELTVKEDQFILFLPSFYFLQSSIRKSRSVYIVRSDNTDTSGCAGAARLAQTVTANTSFHPPALFINIVSSGNRCYDWFRGTLWFSLS